MATLYFIVTINMNKCCHIHDLISMATLNPVQLLLHITSVTNLMNSRRAHHIYQGGSITGFSKFSLERGLIKISTLTINSHTSPSLSLSSHSLSRPSLSHRVLNNSQLSLISLSHTLSLTHFSPNGVEVWISSNGSQKGVSIRVLRQRFKFWFFINSFNRRFYNDGILISQGSSLAGFELGFLSN